MLLINNLSLTMQSDIVCIIIKVFIFTIIFLVDCYNNYYFEQAHSFNTHDHYSLTILLLITLGHQLQQNLVYI